MQRLLYKIKKNIYNSCCIKYIYLLPVSTKNHLKIGDNYYYIFFFILYKYSLVRLCIRFSLFTYIHKFFFFLVYYCKDLYTCKDVDCLGGNDRRRLHGRFWIAGKKR